MMKKWLAMLLTGLFLIVSMGCSAANGGLTDAENDNSLASLEHEKDEENGLSEESKEPGKEAKDDSITILVDDTLFSNIHSPERLIGELEARTGLSLQFIQIETEGYYDVVEQTLKGEDWPDIIWLDGSHYTEYAARGALWDMSDSYSRAYWKEKVSEPKIIESFRLDNKLYGIAPVYGNGYITYVKKEWLANCGLDVPTNYAEFIEMCEAFTSGDPDGNGIEGDTFAITIPDILEAGAPYIGYLPEIYQDAYPGFYQDGNGVWRDGFTQNAMREAMMRLRNAYRQGFLDPDILTNDENLCYDKFRQDKCGVITYWSGTFATELRSGLEAGERSGELVALAPIEEVAAYWIQPSNFWCITTACEEPEKAFRFLGSMMEGGDTEFLWTYGVEGVHWSMEDGYFFGKTYEDGEFHGLRNRKRSGTVYTMACIDPLFALVPLTNSTVSDPVVNFGEEALTSAQIFRENSVATAIIPYTEEMAYYYDILEDLKKELILEVMAGNLSVEEAMDIYTSGQGGEWSGRILDSLNQR